MTVHQRGALARLLWHRRDELLRSVAETEEDLQWLAQDRESEMVERSQEARDTRLLALLGDRERQEIDEIFAAIGRLRAGTYGICLKCGRDVPVERLFILPATRFCSTCARVQEMEEMQPSA